MTSFVELDGHRALSARVHVPQAGPWHADVDLELAPEVSGRVTLRLGTLELSGTVIDIESGTLAAQRKVTILAGAGGWTTTRLSAKAYHNDAGIRARTVAEDAAREAGESLGSTFAPAAERIGIDYVRPVRLASRVLEDAIGSAAWWVDYAGDTQVGARTETAAEPGSYEVLAFTPRGGRLVTLAVTDLAAVGIGSILSDRLDASETVRELDLIVDEDRVRVQALCGPTERSWFTDAIRSVVRSELERCLFGHYHYRVVAMDANRVKLQAVSRAPGLPDVLPISMWPGVAGAHADLTPGAEVLLVFIAGDRTRPVVTHFAGKDGEGWAPANLTLDATTLIKLGEDAANFVALANLTKARLDTLQNAHDTHKHATAATGPAVVPDVIVGPLADIAATKVKAE